MWIWTQSGLPGHEGSGRVTGLIQVDWVQALVGFVVVGSVSGSLIDSLLVDQRPCRSDCSRYDAAIERERVPEGCILRWCCYSYPTSCCLRKHRAEFE